MNRPSVAVCFHRLGPYHLARLLAARERVPGLVAVEWSGVDATYAWDAVASSGLDRRTLFPGQDPENLPAADLRAALDRAFPVPPAAVCVNGWGFPTARAALRWAGQRGIPAIMMSDSTAWDEPRRLPKEAVKRLLLSRCSAALVAGSPHRDYLIALGLAPEAIFPGYDVVDNAHFAQARSAYRAALATRRYPWLPEQPYLLASARFVPKKNLPRLIAAYAAYRTQAAQPLPLVLLGDGPAKPSVEAAIAAAGVQPHLILPGFLQYGDLPACYGGAAAFIHASTVEQWGLVVNEAMAAGLPVLVSHRCGCAADLVETGRNGFTFDPFSTPAITAALLAFDRLTPAERAAFGQASLARIADYAPARFAEGLAAAGAYARAHPARPLPLSGLVLRLLA